MLRDLSYYSPDHPLNGLPNGTHIFECWVDGWDYREIKSWCVDNGFRCCLLTYNNGDFLARLTTMDRPAAVLFKLTWA